MVSSMRRLGVFVAMVLLAGVVGFALWPPRAQAPVGEQEARVAAPVEGFARVEVSTSGQAGLALSGRVLDARGQPIADAEVLLMASEERTVAALRCKHCGAPLLSCAAPETALHLHTVLEQGQGFLEPRATARTDGQGRFLFPGLRGVSFTVWARAPGFGPALRERAAPGEPVQLYLPRERQLEGRVVDADGRPIARARVFAVSLKAPLRYEAHADGQGAFSLRGLGEGPFHVLATAEGFVPQVALRAEVGPWPTELRLEPARTLEVRVTRYGRPEQATVQLQGEHLSREAHTRQGLARFERLSPLELAVMAETVQGWGAEPRVLVPRELLTQVELELKEAGTLLVTLVDEARGPVPSPRVVLYTPEGRLLRSSQADTGALVTLGSVATGDYVVEGQAVGFHPAQLPVHVGQGEKPLELQLFRAPRISGQVLDMYGRPAAGVRVQPRPTGEPVLADEEGHFMAPVPTAGLYTLRAHHPEWGVGQAQVTAPAEGVRLELQPGAAVEVTAVAQGQRVAGVELTLVSVEGSSLQGRRPTGADGVVSIHGLAPGTYAGTLTHAEYLPAPFQLLVAEEGQTLRMTLELRGGASLAGKVVDVQGAPVAGASVVAIPLPEAGGEVEPGAYKGPVLTNSQGHFELRALPSGASYHLRAEHPGHGQKQVVMGQAGGEPVQLVLEPRRKYRGVVVSEQGAPVSRFRLNGREVMDPEGRFETGLTVVDGRVWLTLEAQGFQPAQVARPAQPDLGRLELKRAAVLRGRVLDETGAPVAEALVMNERGRNWAVTDAEGRFELPATLQTERVQVTVRRGRLRGAATVASLEAPVEVVLRLPTRLHGRVMREEGQPAAGRFLYGVNLEQGERTSMVTGPDGRYATELAPGQYLLFVGAESGSGAAQEWRGRVEGAEQQLDFHLAAGAASPASP